MNIKKIKKRHGVKPDARSPYSAPSLRAYGSVGILTQGGSAGKQEVKGNSQKQRA